MLLFSFVLVANSAKARKHGLGRSVVCCARAYISEYGRGVAFRTAVSYSLSDSGTGKKLFAL